jgi:hypothetical protein
MRKYVSAAAVALALGIVAFVSPAQAVPVGAEFIPSKGDGDESKFYFDKKSLINDFITGDATFFGSTPINTPADNVDVSTVGTIKDLGNGFGTVLGHNTGADLLTSLTFMPTPGTTFDGMIFRGQLSGTGFDGVIHVHVVGVDSSVTNLLFTGLKKDRDFGDLGFEAANDLTLVQSVTISTDPGSFFEEFKQVEFSGVNGQITVSEPPTLMIAGFVLVLGFFVYRRNAFRISHQ